MTSHTPGDPGEKKIFIDEDWKSRVEAEKEAARRQPPPDGPAESGESAADEDAEAFELPPASFTSLVSSLMSQALYALGQFPNEDGSLPAPQWNLARHLIDTLEILQQKTAGNLSEEESGMLGEVLHQLRMGYVAMQQEQARQQDRPPSI